MLPGCISDFSAIGVLIEGEVLTLNHFLLLIISDLFLIASKMQDLVNEYNFIAEKLHLLTSI